MHMSKGIQNCFHQDTDDMNNLSGVDPTQNNDSNDEWEVHYDHEGNQYYVSRYTWESGMGNT